MGIKVNKNTFTKYVRDVRLVVGEALERNRRTWGCHYRNGQSDEVAFGARKYKRVRKYMGRIGFFHIHELWRTS